MLYLVYAYEAYGHENMVKVVVKVKDETVAEQFLEANVEFNSEMISYYNKKAGGWVATGTTGASADDVTMENR